MTLTLWVNALTGERLTRTQLGVLQRRAREVYAANGHIFEDELDALSALGVVPLVEMMSTA